MSAGGAVDENQDLNVCLASSQTLLFSVLPAQVTHPVASSWVQFLPPGSSQSIYHFFLLIQVLISILSVQSLSHVRLFATPWTATHQTSLSITISQSLLTHMSIELVMSSNHFILCRQLLLPSVRVCLQSDPASGSFPMIGSIRTWAS